MTDLAIVGVVFAVCALVVNVIIWAKISSDIKWYDKVESLSYEDQKELVSMALEYRKKYGSVGRK